MDVVILLHNIPDVNSSIDNSSTVEAHMFVYSTATAIDDSV